MKSSNQAQVELAKELYDRHVKILEPEHWGKFAAVTSDGQVFLGETTLEVLDAASAQGEAGSLIFKVGEVAVGRWR